MHDHRSGFGGILFFIFLLGVASLDLVHAETPQPRAEVGREMRVVEDELVRPKDVAVPNEGAQESLRELVEPKSDQQLEEAHGELHGEIHRLVFKGDVIWLAELKADSALQRFLVGRKMDAEYIRQVIAQVEQSLIDQGYYLASVWLQEIDEDSGVVTLHVDAGRVGNIHFAFKDKQDGTYFSKRQLEKRMRRTVSGDIFNYNDFYADIYDINIHPDLIVDTDFSVESRIEDEILRRDINMNFTVEEKRPLHAVISLNNYGTDATDNWQMGLTLQHLNLSRNDDVLTVSIPLSIDFESLRSVAASYSIPYYARKGGRITTYGGYSKLDAQEVVEEIDIIGEGWFAGVQWSHNLIVGRDHLLAGSVGFVRRYIEDQLVVSDFSTTPRDATVMPYSLALSYTQLKPDRLGGRNMATIQALYNKGDFLGVSGGEDIRTLRPAAEADYFITRFQLARIQPIFGLRDERGQQESQWVLFARAEGQYADGPLIPAEQIGIGGSRSVRGYVEREFFGDDGGFGNLELRTPLLLGMFSRFFNARLAEGQRYPLDRFQGVFFADGGYTRVRQPLPNEDKDEAIYSAGLGFRVAVSDYAQLRADWGFPLTDTEESDSSGAGYIEFQVQF